MGTYSYSRLNTFQQCKLRYKYQYIDKVETEIENTIEGFMGGLVHEVLEKLYMDVKFQKLPSLQELLEHYDDLWAKNWNDAIIIVRKQYSAENFKKMGVKFITDYYNRYKPFDQTKILALETMRKVEIAPGILFHIRIDRLAMDDDVYEIHDYKTSNSLPTQQDIDKDRQLSIYAYGLKLMYPDARKIRLIWHYLAFDKEICIERSDEELKHVKEGMLEIIKLVETCTDWPAKESALCRWCSFQPICPKWKHQFELEDKDVNEYLDDDGVKLVNKFAEVYEKCKDVEEEKEKLKEALIAFAKKNDVEIVYGSDVKAAIYTYPRLSFPKRDDPRQNEFFAVLRKIGLWDDLAQPNVYELAKLINNKEIHADLVKLLDRFIEKGETNRVYLRKK